MTTTPAHPTIIRSAIERIVGASVRTGIPGRIEAYDAVHQRARVQPLILDGAIDPNSDERTVRRLPVINDVPVVFPGTARARMTFDLQAGDTVWLMMSSHSLDVWLVQGGEVDPLDDRRHNISDAVAIPGLFDFGHVPSGAVQGASTSGAVVHTTTTIKLGGADASDPVARKSDVDAVVDQVNAIRTALLTHTHLGVTTGPGTSGTPTLGTVGNAVTKPACSPVTRSK